ncbi:M61 family peptidase [Dyella monticola]|uniref:M61 family peptidase n=1 Tax=Dyella monticola TaxID=1927958 RepID=A0A370WYR4_9GAMM|nr:M61 family metallopeptidase [Dyella monticola]RDS81298.1 M61 family peptidase [Dyella monticola]
MRPTYPHCLTSFLCVCTLAANQVTVAQDLPQALDKPYPGELKLSVDMTHAPLRIFQIDEDIPVRSGPIDLYYPKWIPGDHSPSGPLRDIAGLVITGNGKSIPWRRDLKEMYAIHLTVPPGVETLKLSFQFLSPATGIEMAATSALAVLEFNGVAFYPAGFFARDIRVAPSVTFPSGWKFATALKVASQTGNTVSFESVSFNNLVDSPVIAGQYFNRIDLAPGASTPVMLDIVGDSQSDVAITPKEIAGLRNVVTQANRLFDAHHYEHYDFLATLTDQAHHFGLEHHQSSDNRLPADFFKDPDGYLLDEDLMPHEFVHSWNGKFRRPEDLWTPTFMEPMQDDLLWVYEGLTEYWCGVLTTRAGIWTPTEYRQSLASVASIMANRTGRTWRSLQDTADSAQLLYSSPSEWINYRRATDFYPEGQLLWLDVDTKIRSLSHGKRSLDDFAKLFFGMDNGSYVTKTYTYDELISALNSIQRYDWNTFLRQRLDYTGNDLPEHGIQAGGWNVVYDDVPNVIEKSIEKIHPGINLSNSLGITVSDNGVIRDVQWDSAAAKAGLVPGLSIVAVNGKNFDRNVLLDAIRDAHLTATAMVFLVKNNDAFSTVQLNYHGGLRYAHLVRTHGEDLIDEITRPLN